MNKNNDITVVIRSCGERTLEWCKTIAQKQVPKEHIHIINERPFNNAVIKNFEIGIEQNKKWTLALDADILLSDDAVPTLIQLGESLGDGFFEVQGGVLDKLYGTHRGGGPHLYRTKYLKEALAFIPEDGHRPETAVIRKMAQQNRHYYQGTEIFGIHDYEQFYEDIFRKCFMHAHKNKNWIAYFRKLWKSHSREDPDFKIALWGLITGSLYEEDVIVDKEFLKQEIRDILEIKRIKEKTPLSEGTFDDDYVKKALSQHQPTGYIKDFESSIFYKTKRSDQQTRSAKPLIIKKILLKSGRLLERVGLSLKTLANK